MRALDVKVGSKYGNLTILEIYSGNKNQPRTVKCKCDCGNIKTLLLNNVVRGSTKSCGCLAIERTRKMGLSTRKHEGCSYCGSSKHYAKGLCGPCYSRYLRTGSPDRKNLTAIDCYDLDGKFIKTYDNMSEASAQTGVSVNTISACARKNGRYAGGYIFVRHGEPLQLTQKKTRKIKRINIFDSSNNFIKEVKKVSEVKAFFEEQGLKFTHQGLMQAIKTKTHRYKKYRFEVEFIGEGMANV